MNFPLLDIDIQQIIKRTRNESHKILVEIICKIWNNFYECGKEMYDSGLYWTKENIKEWLEISQMCLKSDAATVLVNAIYENVNEAYQQGVRASGKVVEVPLDTIKIYPCFSQKPPKEEKMQKKERFFLKSGFLQSQIILDSNNNLIDGYTSYLLAKKYNVENIPVMYGKRQIIKAYHKPGGKLYIWELPRLLIDRVSAGDKVLVHTQKGIRVVSVAAVEEYTGNGSEPLIMVFRIKEKQKADRKDELCNDEKRS